MVMEGAMGMVGSEGQRPLKDQLTPYKVALLVVVEQQCCSMSQTKGDAHQYTDRDEREFMIVLLQLVQVHYIYWHYIRLV